MFPYHRLRILFCSRERLNYFYVIPFETFKCQLNGVGKLSPVVQFIFRFSKFLLRVGKFCGCNKLAKFPDIYTGEDTLSLHDALPISF
ncbi:UNVERIFIED_CONTAM: hypothetical protein [Bacteriophage sp.]